METITELSFFTVTDLWEKRQEIFKDSSVSLKNITKVDASGIAFLAIWAKSLQGSKLKLEHVPNNVLNLIDTYKLNELFIIEN
jgi:ABC-type transporter Mla MlaB component